MARRIEIRGRPQEFFDVLMNFNFTAEIAAGDYLPTALEDQATLPLTFVSNVATDWTAGETAELLSGVRVQKAMQFVRAQYAGVALVSPNFIELKAWVQSKYDSNRNAVLARNQRDTQRTLPAAFQDAGGTWRRA